MSIYEDTYKVPAGFDAFFIKIHRCIECYALLCSPSNPYVMPDRVTSVKVVVKRGTDNKLFEYTVYNHTSCTCGPKSKRRQEHYTGRIVREGKKTNVKIEVVIHAVMGHSHKYYTK